MAQAISAIIGGRLRRLTTGTITVVRAPAMISFTGCDGCASCFTQAKIRANQHHEDQKIGNGRSQTFPQLGRRHTTRNTTPTLHVVNSRPSGVRRQVKFTYRVTITALCPEVGSQSDIRSFFLYGSDDPIKCRDPHNRYVHGSGIVVAVCAGTSLMLTSHMWPKWLVCFAALLSPIQALQGTPVFCNLLDPCQTSPAAGDHHHGCCQHESTGSNCGQDACDVSKASDADIALTVPLPPNRCPQSCWCHRSAQPQPNLNGSTRLNVVVDLVNLVLDQSVISQRPLVNRQFSIERPDALASAQEICASLCRFLA